jgi:fatty acid desaturase
MCQKTKNSTENVPLIAKHPAGDEKAPENAWLKKFDLVAFKADIDALGAKLEAAQGPADVAHLDKIIMWSNMCFFLGALTMWYKVNLFSIVMLSTFTFSRWTMIAHHTCHGGYDKVHPNKNRFNRFKFAVGSLWNRMCDWFDWMMPEAWNVEHNNRHHYCLSELEDPDLVENNLKSIREMQAPVALKYLIVGINMMTWKWAYYAPNTYKELKLAKLRRAGKPMPAGVDTTDALTIRCLLAGNSTFYSLWEFITVVAGPYLLIHFFLMPAFLLFVENYAGVAPGTYYIPAVKNLFCAEILTNVHAFVAIVTNHAGDDMYRFRDACTPYSGSFYLRQVLASVDFSYGSDLVDFLHGWLNYQVEHHLWPNLSMLSYQKAGPLVKAICVKHGVPYVQQNVFWRVHKTAEIMVGTTSMRWFPEAKEAEFIKIDAAQKIKSKMTGSKD